MKRRSSLCYLEDIGIKTMNNWSEGIVNIEGMQIHYCRTGGDKPQVVLNHGATDDGLCWTRVAKELQADYDLVMVDARGHGLSSSGKGDYLSVSRAEDLSGLIQTLDLNRPVVGGHSMGADTSMYLASIYPDQVRGIFMEDPPIPIPGEPLFGGEVGEKYADPGKMISNIMRIFKILPMFIGKPLARRMMPTSPDDEIIPWLNSKKRLSGDFLRSLRNASLVHQVEPIDLIQKINIPMLLIIGDRDKGAIVSKEVAHELAGAGPNLKVVHLAGASHDIRRAKFEGYMQALREFLVEVYQ
ncbi:MAG: alpha/beta hydrolase [Chloroflexi bacterium]|nr:alpha/beta hydrolase [Chloroflexota bacterium]